MMALRQIFRRLPRAHHTLSSAPQEATKGKIQRRRLQCSSSFSSESALSNHDQKDQKLSQKSSGGGATASYTIKESSDGGATTTLRDRVKIISLGRGVVHVLLSRPDKLNSLDVPMFEAIADAASRLRDDDSLSRNLRAVILSGEGRAFCTGLDAKGVALSGPSESLKRLLERPSPYGGEGGLGNLAQDVCYLWRRVRSCCPPLFVFRDIGHFSFFFAIAYNTAELCSRRIQGAARSCDSRSPRDVFWGR